MIEYFTRMLLHGDLPPFMHSNETRNCNEERKALGKKNNHSHDVPPLNFGHGLRHHPMHWFLLLFQDLHEFCEL